MKHRTFSIKPAEIQKKWYVIDASNLVVGRLSSIVAKILRGKHKATYTPHMDMGDNVIIINAEKIALTGKKGDKRLGRKFFWHTGYPGGIKEITSGKILAGRFPERVLKNSILRMLPKESPLARQQFSNLYVYAGAEHPHAGQKPEILDIAAMNEKNKR